MKKPKTAEHYRTKIKAGSYPSIGLLKRSLGRSLLAKREKDELIQFAEETSPSKAPKPHKVNKEPKRQGRGVGDANGTGESRLVTIIKLMRPESTRAGLLRLVAKSVDEGKTLPELHEELRELDRHLPAV